MTNFSPIPAPPSSDEPAEAFASLLSVLRRQVALFEQLNELAAGQAPLIEQAEGPVLLELLAARQHAVDELLTADDCVKRLVPQQSRFSASQRAVVADFTSQLRDLRQSLARIDDRDQARLREVQARLSMEMSRATQSSHAARAYGAAAATAPKPAGDYAAWSSGRTTSRFTDHQG